MNSKTIGVLLSMAFVSVIVYLSALFNTKPLHAATILVFPGVAIVDNSLLPLAQVDLELNASVDTSSATTTEEATSTVPSLFVGSTTDLDLYTRTLAEDDDNLSDVVVTEESISITYREPARILGFIPAEVPVTVEVKNDGTVIVQYPWYAFLAGKNASEFKPGLQLRVGEILSRNSTGTTTPEQLSPQVRAELIQAVHATLKDYTMDVNATTTAEVR